MADERLVAALLQQELDAAQRPATMNPNLAAQGQRMNLPARQAPGPFAEFATQAASLDPQPDQGYGTMAAEMALGFVPGVGQAMAARDIERARRDDDPLGMGMAASSFVPFGKLIGALPGRKQMGPMLGMNTTRFGRIPETHADANLLAQMLDRAGRNAGYEVAFENSAISPSRYLTFSKDGVDHAAKVRISNHPDYHKEAGRYRVDPETGNTFENATRWLADQGYPTSLSTRYKNVPTLEEGMQIDAASRLLERQQATAKTLEKAKTFTPTFDDLLISSTKLDKGRRYDILDRNAQKRSFYSRDIPEEIKTNPDRTVLYKYLSNAFKDG